jgi:hypothetical protein
MKQKFSPFILAVLLAVFSLTSCSKTDVQDNFQDTAATEAKGGSHGGGHHGGGHHGGGHHGGGHHGGGHHGGGHGCHNPHCHVPNCPNNPVCPTAVATADYATYGLDFLSTPQRVGINANIFYFNSGPAGSFNVVLTNATNAVLNTWTIAAAQVNAGDTGTFQVQQVVDYTDFPCNISVEGRPSNLQCTIRSNNIFLIENNVDKHK